MSTTLLQRNLVNDLYVTRTERCDSSTVIQALLTPDIAGNVELRSTEIQRSSKLFLQALPLLSQALENEDFKGLADPRLEKNYVENEMLRMIEAASACVRH
ncbi:hypothetical protein ACE6H2_011986 [Prunus campanulata]